MFVQDCMTHDPVTVRPESDPLAAVALLKCGGFRRLPVVDEDDKLIGIVTRNDLEVFLSRAGSPGVLKRQHRVEQVMNRKVITVPPDCPLEEAANLMGVSRQTFGRVLAAARRSVSTSLVGGLSLRIEGGSYEMAPAPGRGGPGRGRRRRRRA